jgi:acetylglutamate kinase
MKPVVVKIGGSTLGSHDTAIEDIAALHSAGRDLIVVHGGGNAATEWLKIHGIASEFVDGLRVTNAEALTVVTAVFAGLVNKELVCQLLARGVKAVGVSGADGGMIATSRIDDRLGFVGEVEAVDVALLRALTASGFLPVVSPVSFWDQQPGQLMNVNADAIAGAIAAALCAGELVFLTDVPGVKSAGGEWLAALSADAAEELLASGVAAGGMAPKVQACVAAARAGARARIVDGREPHALRAALEGAQIGTTIAG